MPIAFSASRFVDVAAAARAKMPVTPGAPTCWHCRRPIHPLDTVHAARCSTLQEFARQVNR